MDWESNLCLLHWQADSLPVCHQGICFNGFCFEKKKNKTVKVFGVPQESRVPKEECLSQLALTGEEG